MEWFFSPLLRSSFFRFFFFLVSRTCSKIISYLVFWLLLPLQTAQFHRIVDEFINWMLEGTQRRECFILSSSYSTFKCKACSWNRYLTHHISFGFRMKRSPRNTKPNQYKHTNTVKDALLLIIPSNNDFIF